MFEIKIDDLSGLAIQALLSDHQERMAENSPPESRHVLDLNALQQSEITLWSMWCTGELVGCIALKHWSTHLAEIKSMKTSSTFTRMGVGTRLLEYVIQIAKERGYLKLKLETGSMAYFEPARRLYSKHGFFYCDPFADYVEDPNNVFMCLVLE